MSPPHTCASSPKPHTAACPCSEHLSQPTSNKRSTVTNNEAMSGLKSGQNPQRTLHYSSQRASMHRKVGSYSRMKPNSNDTFLQELLQNSMSWNCKIYLDKCIVLHCFMQLQWQWLAFIHVMFQASCKSMSE